MHMYAHNYAIQGSSSRDVNNRIHIIIMLWDYLISARSVNVFALIVIEQSYLISIIKILNLHTNTSTMYIPLDFCIIWH